MESTTASAGRNTSRALTEAETICEAFQITAVDNPDRVALRTKGDETSITWGEYAERVEGVAAGLASLGLERGQTIAIMLVNRPEFHLVDVGAMHLGATPFSIYNTYTAEQIEFLVSDAENQIIVTEQAFADTVRKVRENQPGIKHVVLVDGEPQDEGEITLADLEGRAAPDGFEFEAAWRAINPEDVLTLIYTSGTTGNPKGVQITHANLVAAGRSFNEVIPFPDGARVVSYLPMAHIAERAVTHYLPITCGFTVTCCPDARQVIAYLGEVRPNWFFSVPRIYEKAKAAVEAGIANNPDEAQRKGIEGALDVALKRVRTVQAGEEVPEELEQAYRKADEAVLSKIRAGLGLDELVCCNVGAAPTPPEVIEFFHAIGVPLAELWGMSETCGGGTVNPPEKIKIGTVGPPAPGVEIKLAEEDGEVLLRGPILMKGYRNAPEQTAEAIDSEGWLHTGDIGEFDEDNYLKIVDRKKELIINAAGKNMSPANIEAKVKASSPLIGQAVAIGDRRPYNTALITLDPDAIPAVASKLGIEDTSIEKLASDERIVAAVQEGVDKANEQLARVEQIKKFKILPTDWEPGGEELTPTMKLKRKPIGAKYADDIEGLYS